MSEEKEKPTGKQKLFADFYVGEANKNGTRAARMAGYEGNDNVLAVTASRLLRNAKVSAYIDELLKSCGMSASETIARLADIARGDINDLLDENGHFDINLSRTRGKTPLLKKLKAKRTLRQKKTEVRDDMKTFLAGDEVEEITSDVEIIYEEVEFEIYSAHEALRDLGKYHKLFTDRSEVEANINLKSIGEYNKEAEARLKKAEEAVKKRSE